MDNDSMRELLDDFEDIFVISDYETHEILYINKKGKDVFEMEEDNEKHYCYRVIMGKDDACENCNNCNLSYQKIFKEEFYNPHLNEYFLKLELLSQWGGRKARLELAIENTEGELARQELSDRLETEYLMMQCINLVNSSEHLESTVMETLQIMTEFFKAERIFVCIAGGSDKIAIETYTWPPQDAGLDVIRTLDLEQMYPVWEKLYMTHRDGYLMDVEELGEEHPDIYKKYVDAGIRQLMCAASFTLDGKVGYIGIQNPSVHKSGCMMLFVYVNFLAAEVHRRKYQGQLEYFSFHDELTGLGNHRYYVQFFKSLAVKSYHSMGVFVANINGMNRINGTLGQEYGDEILEHVAGYLKKEFESSYAFRTSGDEFAVVSMDMDRKKFYSKIGKFKEFVESARFCTIAVGATWDDTHISPAVLVESAREQMHQDKREYYASSSGDSKYRRNSVEDLIQSIKKGDFQIYYQPKIDAKTCRIVGAEALSRYIDCEGNVISPAHYIPRLERENTICYLDSFAFSQVGNLMERWYQEGRPLITVSFNFSKLTLLWEPLFSTLEELMGKWHFPREYLEVEITESICEIGEQTMIMLVQQLRSIGLRVSLDDFGVQYSNITTFVNMEFDVLKMDKGLIDSMKDSKKGRVMVESIIDICHRLGVKCLAEGVETKEQFTQLREHNCDYIQGYLFGKPMPLSEFGKLLKKGIIVV